MREEEFLERRLAAREVFDSGCSERFEQWFDGPRHLTADALPVDLHAADTRDLRNVRDAPFHLGFDLEGGEVAHLRERPDLDELARTEDRDAVAERFDLAQDVRRQEDGLS